jgi:hypothetical protein
MADRAAHAELEARRILDESEPDSLKLDYWPARNIPSLLWAGRVRGGPGYPAVVAEAGAALAEALAAFLEEEVLS